MAFTPTQVLLLVEITQETRSTMESLIESADFDAEEESFIVDDIDLWEAKRNKVALEVDSDGISLVTQRLLNAIRQRVRKAFGLDLYSEEVIGASGSFAVPNVAVF
jgi:hypothetical protein